jgi:ferredoxin
MREKFRKRFIRPSTRAFYREARHTKGFSFLDWIHGYVYGRWPYFYISVGTREHPLSRIFQPLGKKFIRLISSHKNVRNGNGNHSMPLSQNLKRGTIADDYHGKVMTLDAAKKMVTINQKIKLNDLEQVIPFSNARDIILKNPDHIVALECPCRAARANPCLPLDVCLIVGEPFASFVAEHNPKSSRWLNPEEAVSVLQAEHDRGHVHHAFFKDAMLGRFYAICNCCSCCCGAMHAMRNGIPMLISSGYISVVEAALCEGCETCVEACQFGALVLKDEISVVDTDLCMGCGVCVSKCEKHAHSLIRDEKRGAPLDIQRLTAASR